MAVCGGGGSYLLFAAIFALSEFPMVGFFGRIFADMLNDVPEATILRHLNHLQVLLEATDVYFMDTFHWLRADIH